MERKKTSSFKQKLKKEKDFLRDRSNKNLTNLKTLRWDLNLGRRSSAIFCWP